MLESNSIVYEKVADYYGKVLKSKKDLKTNACCTLDKLPAYIKEPMALIEDEVQNKYYGCGTPFPLVLKGTNILDLGCGTGRDCFVLSYLAGESGQVVGVDMTAEQLEVANKYIDVHIGKFGFSKPNLEFIRGYIEQLDQLSLNKNFFDVVVSNCVINLSPDKKAVLKGVFDVLREGGEFFFSDVYCDRRLPFWAKEDTVLLGECLGGALYFKDFQSMAKEVGFGDPRIYSISPIELYDAETIDKIGFAKFYSITYRLFKIDNLEVACEDYGQIAIYKGTIAESKNRFVLDDHHTFYKNKPEKVCSNTARMLSETRFKNHFEISGDAFIHFGAFDGCGNLIEKENDGPVLGCC